MRKQTTQARQVGLALVVSLMLAACSGGGTAEPDTSGTATSTDAASAPTTDDAVDESALPSTVTVPLIYDGSGVAEPYASGTLRGWELRFEEANENDEIPGVTFETETFDTQSEAQVAANRMTEVTRSDAVAVGYGTSSAVGPAIAPIADREGLPLVVMYSSGPGVVDVGENIFRVTAPLSSYYGQLSDYLDEQGVSRLAIIYNNDIGTLQELAEVVFPAADEEADYEIVENIGVAASTTDLSSEMTRIVDAEPDAVLSLVLGQQNATVISRLEQEDFDGITAVQPGIGDSVLAGLGEAANGIVWPADFTPSTPVERGQEFVAAFEEKYGNTPNTFDASGYEGASLIIEALKIAEDYSRDAVREALQTITSDVSSSGFESVTGNLTFENRDARVEATLVEWQDGQETLAQ